CRLDPGRRELPVEQLLSEPALGVLLVDPGPAGLGVWARNGIRTIPGVYDAQCSAAQLGLFGRPPQRLPRGLRPVDPDNDARHYVLPCLIVLKSSAPCHSSAHPYGRGPPW